MAMLAAELLQELLASKLTEFFEDVDASQVQFRGGQVLLQDMSLRRDYFNALNLPIRLKSGRVDTFRLRLNLHKIMFTVRRACRHCRTRLTGFTALTRRTRAARQSEPVVLELEDVVLICAPYGDFDEDAYKKIDKETRKTTLEEADKQEAISLESEAQVSMPLPSVRSHLTARAELLSPPPSPAPPSHRRRTRRATRRSSARPFSTLTR